MKKQASHHKHQIRILTWNTNTSVMKNGLILQEVRRGREGGVRGTPEVGMWWATCCRAGNQSGMYSFAFTCYLCFSCFCFSFSNFPSPGCWWMAAWRHSHVQLLQASKQHSGHMSWNPAMENIPTVNRRRDCTMCHISALAFGIPQQCLMLFSRHAGNGSQVVSFSPFPLPRDGQWCHLELE